MRIIVTTCDAYGHIMPDFARAFIRAWPDCAWPVTILWAGQDAKPRRNAIGDTVRQSTIKDMPAQVGDWRLLAIPDMGWAANLIWYLQMEHSADPFLLLLDDYILDAVDTMLVEIARVYIETVDAVGMVRLHPVPGPTLPINADMGEIDKALPYAISLQPAMWRPEVVADLFQADESAWDTEVSGSERATSYDRYRFIGTKRSAIGYRGLMRRGLPVAETQAWIENNLR